MDIKIENSIQEALNLLIAKRSRHIIKLTQEQSHDDSEDHRQAIVNIQKEITKMRMKS